MTDQEKSPGQAAPEHFMLKLWKTAKSGHMEQLSEEEKQLAQIMIDHEDEYGEEFEAFANGEKSSESEESPFVHMTIHATIENQLRDKDPIEAYQFFNNMRKKKISRHESIHLIGCILAHFMYEVMVEHKPFDTEGYKLMLKRYKGKKPAGIYAALETGFE